MATAVPRLFKKAYAGWMAFARGLGFVNTRILLTVVYVLIIGPMRLVQVLLGKDFLDRRPDDRTTNWRPLPIREKKVEDYYHLS